MAKEGKAEDGLPTLSRVCLSRMQSAKRQSSVGRPGCVHSSTFPSSSTMRFSRSMLCFPGRSLTYTGPPLTCTRCIALLIAVAQCTQDHSVARESQLLLGLYQQMSITREKEVV